MNVVSVDPVPMGQPIYPSVDEPHAAPDVTAAVADHIDIESVRVTGWTTDTDGITRYKCSAPRGGANREVVSKHRYTDFVHLHAALGKAGAFPVPKELFMSAASKNQRAAALQSFLRTCNDGTQHSALTLRAFLLGSDAVDGTISLLPPSMPPGLLSQLQVDAREHFPLRIMIIDNSGSMGAGDGSRLVEAGGSRAMQGMPRMVRCTRWQELRDDVVAFAKLSVALDCRSDFHLLNPTRGYSVLSVGPSGSGELAATVGGPAVGSGGVEAVEAAMATSPTGTTPLTEAIQRVVAQIRPSAEVLVAHGQRVVVVLATDGVPDNRSTFLSAVMQLQQLPVWLVVRLCTDDDTVVSYWNDLDTQLEAPLEVLDDLQGEAAEIHSNNPWLTYGRPLHLARLFGMADKLFDALDEERLLPSQARIFAQLLLGWPLPEPELNAAQFSAALECAASSAPSVYDPLKGKMRPWIDVGGMARLARSSSTAECAVM
jgi:hypothetical protein